MDDSRGDDMFANSSTETVVQNIDFSLILKEAANSRESSVTADPVYSTKGYTSDFGSSAPKEVINSQQAVDSSYKAESFGFKVCSSAMKELTDSQAGDFSYKSESFVSNVCSSATKDATDLQVADPSYNAECFVSEVCNFALQLHCPFCCKYFAFEHMLKEHIKLQHGQYWEILRSDNNIILLHSCLFCHAKYYKKCVLLRHILYSHQEVVFAASHGTQLCAFCPYSTIAPSRTKLLHHIEQNHSKEFETLIDGMYVHNGKLEDTMGSTQRTFASFQQSQPANYSSQVLSPIPKSGCTSRKRLRFEEPEEVAIAAPKITTSKWRKFFSFMKLGKNRDDTVKPKFSTSTPKRVSDRKSLMDGDICYLENTCKKPKEASFNKIHKRGFSLNIFSRKKHKYRSLSSKRPAEVGITPTRVFKRKSTCGNKKRAENIAELSCKWAANDEYKIKQFKCAVCLEAFGDNVGLVCHAKRHHNGPLRLLQPSFKCGLCEATFYKNSFLLRHCKFHHTPLCLRG